jgi:hypothetical protein
MVRVPVQWADLTLSMMGMVPRSHTSSFQSPLLTFHSSRALGGQDVAVLERNLVRRRQD